MPPSPLPADQLNRNNFLLAIERHILALAKTPLELLPAPRVIAVDAQWGQGKSWLAQQLSLRLALTRTDEKPSPTVLIDAFRYDHHDDPFAVIASAVIASLNPNEERKKKYLSAAGQVLKSAAPLAIKAATNVGLKFLGLDSDSLSDTAEAVRDAAIDNSGKFSEKAIEKLFESYSRTQIVQDEFIATLSEITKELEQPFVVMIDELDRCRPSFALEVLERIKHLFSADNVVFVLFWNSDSIYESIRHTYGRETKAESYLSKFVALSIPLNIPQSRIHAKKLAYAEFIDAELLRTSNGGTNRENIAKIFTAAANILQPNLREVQKSLQHFQLLSLSNKQFPHFYAYLLILRSISMLRFNGVCSLQKDALSYELALFEANPHDERFETMNPIQALFIWSLNAAHYEMIRTTPTSQKDKDVMQVTSNGQTVKIFLGAAEVIGASIAGGNS